MSCAPDGATTPALTLAPMTRALCRRYFRDFESDPAVCADARTYRPFRYSDEWADAYFDRQRDRDRVHLAVTERGEPVGEVIFKNLDRASGVCTLSVHLQNDAAKGRGVGTQTERLAPAYAFGELGMDTVRADALLHNTRSRHVMEKVGFRLVREDGAFACYEIFRAEFLRSGPGR